MTRRKWILGALLWMTVIFCLSSIPGNDLGPDTTATIMVKKAGHFMLYAILAALYLRSIGTAGQPGLIPFLASFLLSVLYAVSDEFHQSFVPGRHAAVRDVIIDTAGAGAVLCVLYVIGMKNSRAAVRSECHGKTIDCR